MNIVIYPNPRKNSPNPFIKNLSESLNSLNKEEYNDKSIFNLVKHLFDGEIYIFNWPENIAFRTLGFFQFLLLRFCLYILNLRKVQLVWMFHNIEPHQGHNWISKNIFKYFSKNSSLIITLSKQAKKYLQNRVNCSVLDMIHPFDNLYHSVFEYQKEKFWDILIWGSISKYKGILEFIKSKREDPIGKNLKTCIVGKCKDREYLKLLQENIDDSTQLRNEYIQKDGLIDLIKQTKYVVFPYLKNSVSSSGALMDSIQMQATVIGPSVGAFEELKDKQLCFTFENYSEIFKMINDSIEIDPSLLKEFVKDNTWEIFSKKILCIFENKKETLS